MAEPFYFICYSRRDGEEIALRLADQLVAGPPSISVWLDRRPLLVGMDCDEEIVQALGGSAGILYVMTKDSVRLNSECDKELKQALKYKKAIIPLLFDKEVMMPFWLEERQCIDFAHAYGAGLTRLRVQLQQQLDRFKATVRDLQAPQERTRRSIERGLKRERQPELPVATKMLAGTKKMNGQIFISYRREESSGWAGRLSDRLSNHFPSNQIFIDVDSVDLGEDFVKTIEKIVGSCDVLIAVIGKGWLSSCDQEGQRRIDNPEDFVRIEIATALKRDIRVIPVFVDGASMPRSRDLPDDLQSLVRRQALEVSHSRFRTDSERLIGAVERALAKTSP